MLSVCLPFVLAYRTDGWTALGDPTRRAIFERLADRPRAVGELAGELPVSRPAVSQHLKVLKTRGWWSIGRPARAASIRSIRTGSRALRAYLDQFWSKSLAAYKEAVEQPTEEVS